MTETTTDTSQVTQLAQRLAAARARQKEDKELIDTLQPQYFALLDAVYGKGKVDFEYDGHRFGRTIQERTSFDAEAFVAAYPKLRNLVKEEVKLVLDEEAAADYIAEHPEVADLLRLHTKSVYVSAWKNPVPVRNDG